MAGSMSSSSLIERKRPEDAPGQRTALRLRTMLRLLPFLLDRFDSKTAHVREHQSL